MRCERWERTVVEGYVQEGESDENSAASFVRLREVGFGGTVGSEEKVADETSDDGAAALCV